MATYLGKERKDRNPHIVSFSEINTHYFKSAPRTIAPVLSPHDRSQSFLPVEYTLSKEAALEESRRCFNCGICNACDYCRLYCPEMSVIVENAGRMPGDTSTWTTVKGAAFVLQNAPAMPWH
jgi:hypothetical protein